MICNVAVLKLKCRLGGRKCVLMIRRTEVERLQVKVHVFWEGHKILVIWKIWHYLPNGFDATKGLKKFFNLDEISKKVPSHFPDHYMSTKVLKKRCLIRGVICHLSFWDLSPSENIYEIKSSVSTLDFQISRRIL